MKPLQILYRISTITVGFSMAVSSFAAEPKTPFRVVAYVPNWIDRGLAKSKIILGVPFDGYGFGEDHTRSGITYRSISETLLPK